MAEYALPALFVLFVWWFGTGAVLYLDGLPRRTFGWSIGCASALAALSLWGLAAMRDDTTVSAAYAAFLCAMMVWAWNEMVFLMGYVTGPRRHACPAGCKGFAHARHATEAILFHELAILGSGAAIAAVTWGSANQVGLWTFAALWLMRLSTKLNVFLGVRNLSREFLPDHLRYLGSFFSRRAMNPLFPFSITASTVAVFMVAERAIDPGAGAFETTALALMASLLALGLVEHWLLVLPIPAALLWRWGLRSRALAAPEVAVSFEPQPACPNGGNTR